ncbi:MAG: hypothetical protein HY719_08710 [Planctomycetes bacterium]|nr:hypothetical protein [Planctomycetota bacterium]
MTRNMAMSLIDKESIVTTPQKAKNLRPFVEKLVTLAKKKENRLHNFRRCVSLLGNYAGPIPVREEDKGARGASATRQYHPSRKHFRKGHPKHAQTLLLSRRRVAVKLIRKTRNKSETAAKKLFDVLAPRYAARAGGYTRIVRLSWNRLGDNAGQAIIAFVGEDDKRVKKSAPGRVASPLSRKGDKKREKPRGQPRATPPLAPPAESQPSAVPSPGAAPAGGSAAPSGA